MDIIDSEVSHRSITVSMTEDEIKNIVLQKLAQEKNIILEDVNIETKWWITHDGKKYIGHAEIICKK